MSCSVCGSAEDFLDRIFEYDFLECSNFDCQHVRVENVPDDDELSRIYDSDSSHLSNSGSWTLLSDYKTYPERVLRNYSQSRIRDLVARDLLSGTPRICEVGCSTGVFSEILSDYAQEVVGIELGESQRAEMQRRGFRCEKALDDLVTSDSFDLILLYAVVEHLRDPKAEIQKAFERLSDGGTVVIDVPNWDSYYRKTFRTRWIWLIPPIHIHYFNVKSMKKMLTDLGFSKVEVKTLTRSSRLFLVVYHIFQLTGSNLKDASFSGSRSRYLLILTLEAMLRILFFPFEWLGEKKSKGNQLIVFATR